MVAWGFEDFPEEVTHKSGRISRCSSCPVMGQQGRTERGKRQRGRGKGWRPVAVCASVYVRVLLYVCQCVCVCVCLHARCPWDRARREDRHPAEMGNQCMLKSTGMF